MPDESSSAINTTYSGTTRKTSSERLFGDLLSFAGVTINGDNEYDIKVHNPKFYNRVIGKGNLGLGETYMAGWWDCERIDVFIERVLNAKLQDQVGKSKWLSMRLLMTKFINLQSSARAFQTRQQHYDIGNNLFRNMLDPSLTYSCGYWNNAANLAQAQYEKLDLICQKLKLAPGMKVLDIGCGWGGLSAFAARHYGVSVVGITISEEQLAHAQATYNDLDVEFRFMDYRDINESFDRIMSVGMLEHVGHKNLKTYMNMIDRCLVNGGLALIHSIIDTDSGYCGDPWINKYIFVNGFLPSASQVTKAAEPKLVLEDVHNFGPDYDKTLIAWHDNFVENYPKIKENYDETFYRMWRYYLLCSAGSFRARHIQLMQFVFSKGRHEVYWSPR
ncbi:Cyclopropane-fatty-acyl-phospholipid synthase [BD1-7 clade bacterium]|uniref:Cyclopropane-fatty-acyl-phospholipid synthase n=1 Tax=BD1-7 clade bacterium TaxID=2029982 RepID=A0A5S9QS50_9GAMM|nr:Cyclopropane-fatty-acyl-phospholipid synthase [BD1-7 clade bacterium]CAA0122832.1 Cyclopropane-fatty-acyl-phospholipid synthase [BD1-7 clade bacterium]